jgi:glutamate dehydrogenase (NADP+)
MQKLDALGAKVVAASDSSGFIHDPEGIRGERLEWLRDLKETRRGRISEYADKWKGATFHAGKTPWHVPAQLAFPCACENEVDTEGARALIANKVLVVSEGANMPSTPGAVREFLDNDVLFGPAKAANAGGVAVSGLEQTQNSIRQTWSHEEVDQRLRQIMLGIHAQCVEHGRNGKGGVNYVDGANRAGFVKVATAMLAYGLM